MCTCEGAESRRLTPQALQHYLRSHGERHFRGMTQCTYLAFPVMSQVVPGSHVRSVCLLVGWHTPLRGVGMTIGRLRAQSEAELPKFHAVRLMQDGHERRNEAAINVGKLSVDITMLVTSCM